MISGSGYLDRIILVSVGNLWSEDHGIGLESFFDSTKNPLDAKSFQYLTIDTDNLLQNTL